MVLAGYPVYVMRGISEVDAKPPDCREACIPASPGNEGCDNYAYVYYFVILHLVRYAFVRGGL